MNYMELISIEFQKLVVHKGSVNVSINEICQKCGISRTTFYNKFHDKNDIIEYIFIRDTISPSEVLIENHLDYRSFLLGWFMSFYKNKAFYIIAIKNMGQNSLSEIILGQLQELNRRCLVNFNKRLELSDTDIDYLSYKFAAMHVALLQKWIGDEMNISPERLVQYCFMNENFLIKHKTL